MCEKEKAFYKSKKFWATIIGAAIPILRQYGVDIPMESVYPIMAYLVGQGIADHGKNNKQRFL